MKPSFLSPCAYLALCTIGTLPLLAQINSQPPSSGTYVCGPPNNYPAKKPTTCDKPEESSAPKSNAISQRSGPSNSMGTPVNTIRVEIPNNSINPTTGGVVTQTPDIVLPFATGDLPLAFSRYYQTRDTTANGDLMGHGRTFTHSHSWSMWASGAGGNSRSTLMADGNTLDFVPYPGTIAFEGQSAIKYIPEASFGERLYQVGNMYYLLVPGGERYAFESVVDAEGVTRFFPRNRRDSKGNFHTYTTDAAARITKVTDATGNWIEMTYAGVPFDSKQNVVIATITSAPVVGWNEINVTTSQPFQWVQGISAPGINFNMSELEFYAPGTNGANPVKLSGAPYGNGPASSNSSHTFDKLFDNNTSTGFSFIRTGMGIAGLDLGTGNASHIAKIRFFISSFNANRLNSYIGHQFVGRVSTPQIITTLTQVTSSHGDTVQYNYDSYTDPSILQEHLVLKNIDYIKDTNADGIDDLIADAEITWTTSLQGYAPHIERMIEPRKTGNNPDMAFEYLPIRLAPAKGMPFRIKDGATGNSIFLMEHQRTRRYYFADGGIHTIANTAAYFLPDSSTDAEGNVTTYTWDQSHFLRSKTTAAGTTQYTHNYMGQPLTITQPNGLTEAYTYDVQGRLLTNSLSAPGYPTRTTTFTRNSQGKITRITYPDATFENYTYNALGLLTTVREKNGSFTVHTYDTTIGSPTAGLRLSTTRGLSSATATTGGETETFTWTGANEPNGVPARLLQSATDERGRVTSYNYDAQGRLIQTTYPDNSFTQVNYDHFGNKVTEFNGTNVQYWTYDTFRRPLSHTDENGGVTTYDYGLNGSSCSCYGAGAPTLITSPTGRKTRRYYDKKGRVTQEIQGFLTAAAATTLTSYDALGRTISTTDPDGIVTTHTYDSVGNTTSSSISLNTNSTLTTTFTYTPFSETLTTTSPGNRTTSSTYDAAGRLLTSTDPLGLVNAVTYDAAGRTATSIRGAGTALAATTSYTYNAFDRVTSVTHPGGAVTSQTYHPGGAVHTRTNEMGHTWTTSDALESWTDSAGNSWLTWATTTTDPLGKVSKSYSGPIAGGDHATRSISAAGRISETIHIGLTTTQISGLVSTASGLSADPSVVVQTRNAEGETILTAIDPAGINLRTSFTYDALGRQITTTSGVGTSNARTSTTAYNKRGLPITLTGADGRITTRSYDALGRLLSETDPKNQTTSYTYWHETSNIATISDPRSSVTTFSYNARGQRIAKTFHGNTPGGTYTYDVLGRMLTNTTANGHTETYTYDACDRQLTAKWSAAGSLAAINISRTYDAAGRLLTVTQAGATNSSHTYSYNARGENISETQVLFGKTLSFARSYDDDGHLTSLTQPSGRVVNYSTSARGQINGVVSDGPPPLVNYTFDKAGRVTHAWHENGIIEHRQYDALSQLTAINIGTTNQPTSIGVHTYTHDSAGRRTGHNNSGTSVNYTYDNADQVTASTGAIPRSYAYDAAGNRTTATQFGQTLSYTANALNQYTALTNSAAPTYDAAGNTLTLNGAVYAYDQKNQLKSISGLDSNGAMGTVNHQYDSMGRRISSTVNNQSILYVYDGWNVVEEYSSSNLQSFDLKTILTWGIDLSGSAQGAGGVGGLLFTEDITSNTTWHHHYDGNGNVTHLTNASGQTVATYTYDAFGNTVTATGVAATANRYRFSTKPIDEHIATTPLYYYGYRYYHPQTSRWINRDPIEEEGGLNLYGFVGNDGVGKWDMLGNNPFSGGSTNWLKSGTTTCCRKAAGRSGLGVVILWNFNIWRNYDKYINCLDEALDRQAHCFCDCLNAGGTDEICSSRCNREYYNSVLRCAANVSVGDID